jgi:flagellar hook-basal body complex protein FliE
MDDALKRNFQRINDNSRLRTLLKQNRNMAGSFKKFKKGYLEKITEELHEGTVKTQTSTHMVWEGDVMDSAQEASIDFQANLRRLGSLDKWIHATRLQSFLSK